MSYPDPTLTTTYAYDTGAFGKGRPSGITRNGEALAYTYDRFGRLLQDGSLAYTWDKNGNRKTIGYPDSITATYTHDFADRETTLAVQVGANPALQLVNGAAYEPSGPLKTLALGNGLTETRSFDARYAPEEIRVDGTSTVLDWDYTTDLVGNITGIADLRNAANNRTYVYQDIHYFLTQGNGPWGARSWTYDKIGNRLTETRGAATDTYTYPVNAAGGRNPKLQSVAPPTGEPRKYGYDAAGNNILIFDRDTRLDLLYDSANRLSTLRSVAEDRRTNLLYDGRGFLRQASAGVDECRPGVTIPTHDSQGLLHRRAHLSLLAPAAPPSDTDTVFYFAGRPVATLRLYSTGSTLTYLTADHLGTPILATADTGSLIWQGGFEPFGANWNGASAAGVFLRFPGQWVDQEWEGGRLESGLYYNVWRWYGWGVGRYPQLEPLGPAQPIDHLRYARNNPITEKDPLGLFVVDQSCDCSDSDRGHPGYRLGESVSRACSYLKRPGCREALRSHGLEDCYSKRCGQRDFGRGPLIVCSTLTDQCGWTPPNGNIVLYRGNMTCPRVMESKGPTGPRDYSQTFFHEIGHTCGVGPQEPNWRKEVQTICTGWPL